MALYHQTLLLLSETAQEGRSKVLVTARDSTIPPLGPAVASGRSSGFREAVSELDMLVPGQCSRPYTSRCQEIEMVEKASQENERRQHDSSAQICCCVWVAHATKHAKGVHVPMHHDELLTPQVRRVSSTP